MNILVDICHPAHVHFFKHAISAWSKHGHKVHVSARNIPTALDLLNSNSIEHSIIGTRRTGAIGLSVELIEHTAKLVPILKRQKIDTCTSIGGTYMIYAAYIANCKRIVFTDTETSTLANKITFPLADSIITPEVYPHDLGKKHVRYKGFHELAYLHPTHFKPDANVLAKYSLQHGEKFSLVRLCAWEAAHDLKTEKATLQQHLKMIQKLQNVGRVIIAPESEAPEEIKALTTTIDPEDFHSLLSYAHCCVSEGATTASEACMMGTPVLYINPIRPCYIPILSESGLLKLAVPADDMCVSLDSVLRLADNRADIDAKLKLLLSGLCDVTEVIIESIENSQT